VPEPPAGCPAEEDLTAASIETKPEVEEVPDTSETLAEEVPDTSEAPAEENVHNNEYELPIVEEVPQESVQNDEHESQNVVNELPFAEEIRTDKLVSVVSLETMETDYVRSDESDEPMSSTPEGIRTPEEPAEESWDVSSPPMENYEENYDGSPPVVWCGMPQADLSPMGWMPVVVPAEHAPPGAFDGIWRNHGEERIEINHSEILFESGEKWVIQMHSLTSLSVCVGDEEFHAELEPEARTLSWSDGDVWTCIGQTENQKNWVENDVQSLLLETAAAQMAGEQFFMDTSPTETIPEDAQAWEICWDWKKKGWCPRADCKWYHPVQPGFPCTPCGMNDTAAFFDGPFADEQHSQPFNPGLPMMAF